MSTKAQREKVRALLAEMGPEPIIDVLVADCADGRGPAYDIVQHFTRSGGHLLAEARANRARESHRHTRPCEHCRNEFVAYRTDSRYCSTRCRVAAHRARVTAVTSPAVEPVPVVVVDHAEAAAEATGAMAPDRWAEGRAARKADHEAGRHGEFVVGCPPCEDDHGRHAGLEEFVGGCASCEADEEALNAKKEAEFAVRLKAERKEAREAARARAAWLKSNPEAIAWRCTSCEQEFTDEDADQGQGALYECGECGSTFSRGNSADGNSNHCPECSRFGAKLAELACPECGEGELEPLEAEAYVTDTPLVDNGAVTP